jgi:tetratricopeptide (TPR) repeat protein
MTSRVEYLKTPIKILSGIFGIFFSLCLFIACSGLTGCSTTQSSLTSSDEVAHLAGAEALLSKALTLANEENANTNAVNTEISEALRLANHLAPDSTNILERAMYCLVSRRLYNNAYQLSQNYLKRNPDARSIRFAAACCADAAGKTDVAAEECEKLYTLDPDDREIEETLIRLYFYSNQGARALQMIQTAYEHHPDKASLAMPSKWAVHFITRDKDFVRGLHCLNIALAQNHHPASVRSALLTLAGECYLQTKQPHVAITNLLAAYETDANNLQPIQRLSVVAIAYPATTNRLQELATDYQQSNPLLSELLHAVLEQSSDNKTAAIESLRRAHDASMAAGYFPPEGLYLWRITLLDLAKRSAEAIPILKDALAVHRSSEQLKNTLAYLWAEQGTNLEEASKLINEVLQSVPRNAAYLDTKGWILFKMKRPYDALQYLLKAAELDKDPVVFDHAGDALAATGMQAEAVEFWKKSFELDPKSDVEKKFKK